MRIGGFISFLLGAIAGILVGWALHNYPDSVVSEATYCRLCGSRLLETQPGSYLGNEKETQSPGSALHRLMVAFNGDHPHEWAVPRAYVAPTHPAPQLSTSQQIAQEVMKRKLNDLQHLEEWAKGLGILESAMRNNRFRTVALVQRILDERSYMDFNVILILDREAPWSERWAIMDAFLNAYRCHHEEELFQCVLVVNGKDKIMFTRDPSNVQASSIDWRNWMPDKTTPALLEAVDEPGDTAPAPSGDAEPSESSEGDASDDTEEPDEATEDSPSPVPAEATP